MGARLKMRKAAGSQMRASAREIKMLRPICEVCASNTDAAARGWWNDCPHEPYVGTRTETVTTREYEDVKDGAGKPTGERIVKGTVEKSIEKPWPNLVSVSVGVRINSGNGVEKKRVRFGYILPEELRCDAYPEGIDPFCQFRECYEQEGLKEYRHGLFCREQEAALVYQDESGKTREIYNDDRMKDEWADVLSKVRIGA